MSCEGLEPSTTKLKVSDSTFELTARMLNLCADQSLATL